MAIKYVPYMPEPVSGQAILSNFNRLLKYKGSNEVSWRIERGMPLFEAELKEMVGKENSGNMIFRGDCVSTCAYLKSKGITVDLVYIDPPFASGADYAKKVYLRRNPKVAETIAKAESELDLEDIKQFEEKMYGDIWDKEKYLNWMYENLMAIRSVMSENAAIYVHLDWHIVHYVKILMDEIFGEDNFRNEIVWCYKTSLHASENAFGKDHDTILFYAMSPEVQIHPDKSDFPSSESTLKRWGKYADENGFVSNANFAGSKSTIINTSDASKGFNIHYGIPRDWWEISSNVSKGNTEEVSAGKYSTQKPEKLLQIILKSSSEKNNYIADFFGGSGVTAAVATKLGRRFIHSDININSIETTRDRLKQLNADFDIYEIKDGVTFYRNPVQTMDKLKSLIPGLKDNPDLDDFWAGSIPDIKYGTVPVYVPNLMDSTTRILDEVLMRRILKQIIPELEDENIIKKVIVYYIDVSDMDKIQEMVRKENDYDIIIEFRDLKELLDDIVLEDEMDFEIKEDRSKLGEHYILDITRFYSDAVVRRINSFNLKNAQNDKKGKFKPIEISDNGMELIEMVSVDGTSSEGPWHSDNEIKIDYTSKLIIDGKKTDKYWDGKMSCSVKPLRVKVRNICGDETVFPAAQRRRADDRSQSVHRRHTPCHGP